MLTEAILFYRRQDIGAQSFKTAEGRIDSEILQRLEERIAAAGGAVDARELAGEAGLTERKLAAALQQLEDAGAIETRAMGEVCRTGEVQPEDAARIAAENQERRHELKKERLAMMRAYAEATTCRRELLLRYLGDDFAGPCHSCDNCEAAAGAAPVASAAGTRREVV